MRHLAVLALVGGCASSQAPDPGLEGLSLHKVKPGTIIPGTKVIVTGESFVDDHWGATTLHLQGQVGGKTIDEHWDAKFVDFNTLTIAIDGARIDALGGDVDFHGSVTVDVIATSDGNTYSTDTITTDLKFRKKLVPSLTGIVTGVIFVNDQIEIDGDGFLLGGDEGSTFARVTGCFKPDTSSTCTAVQQQDIAVVPTEELTRNHGSFPFSPKIAGIKPGAFTGKVTLVNKPPAGAQDVASDVDVSYTMVTPQVFSLEVHDPKTNSPISPPAASLGQFVFVHGGGFVGGESTALTQLEFSGTFNKTDENPAQVLMTLIPDFVEGKLARYVLNKDDALGMSINLYKETGHFTGKVTPITSYGAQTVRGASTNVVFDIAPVRQVVFLDFTPAYVEELRDFGMRAVDKQVRERILAVITEAYKGVNMDFRTTPPTDFSMFEHVTLVGIDPNNMGLFGYDNSPGKDDGNTRLYDQIGGVNATTQQDGYPGYGGVFVRSMMGFSKHPGSLAKSVPGADDKFDAIFDPFRADVDDGAPVTAGDLSGGYSALTSGDSCPGTERKAQVECAVFVLGGVIGGTLAHEIGHSLGLANPYEDGFHDSGDAPNRLMDSGGDRPFLERAQIDGQGPAVFCDAEYDYLREILPSSEPANTVERPSCY